MHYIRFLKPPSLSQTSRGVVGLQLSAKITITSDLGESFLCFDLPLLAILQNETGDRVQVHQCKWKPGNRQLEISFPVTQNALMSAVKWPCRLIVQPQDASYPLDQFVHILAASTNQLPPAWSVLSVLSEEFPGYAKGNTSRRVQRQLSTAGKGVLCIWEDTGESIARHIWDAGLLLSAFLDSYGQDIEQNLQTQRLHYIQNVLSKKKLEILELGAGCGIVGITIAGRFSNSKVILTDLPEAEDIARHNISVNVSKSRSKSSPPNIEYQNLDWAEPLPKNLCHGDLDLVLVADCTYNPDAVPDLVKTLADVVKHNPQVVIMLAMKVRHDSEMIFFDLMAKEHMVVLDKLILPLPLLGQEAEEIELYLFKGNLALEAFNSRPSTS